MQLSSFDRLARRHHGVIHRAQAGVSQSAWHRALAAGMIIHLHPNIARCVGTEPTDLQRAMAATLAIPDSVASHVTAAQLWGLAPGANVVDGDVHVTTPDRSRQWRRLEGVVCHRPRDRVDVRGVRRNGVPTTPPFRTLLDLGITNPDLVHGAVGIALSSGLLTINGIEAGLQRHAVQGRHGVVALRTALDEWAIDARPADSILESAFVELCRRHRLPPPNFHERIEGWEVDFRFPGTAVVVECDGWTTHGRRRDQFERDRRKDDDLRGAGWVPARLTYRAITRQQADTARRLRRLLARWSDHPAPDAAPHLGPAA